VFHAEASGGSQLFLAEARMRFLFLKLYSSDFTHCDMLNIIKALLSTT